MSASLSVKFFAVRPEKLRLVAGGFYLVVCILLFMIILSSVPIDSFTPASRNNNVQQMTELDTDNPNNVTVGLSKVKYETGQFLDETRVALYNGSRIIAVKTILGSKFIVHGNENFGRALGRGVVASTSFIVSSVVKSITFVAVAYWHYLVFVAHIPVYSFHFIANLPSPKEFIRPADKFTNIPVIKPGAKAVLASSTKPPILQPPVQTTAALTTDINGAWPIHGRITTRFGVYESVSRTIHSGLDISDGKGSGITSIKPFKPGRVASVIHSSYGLGNHVVIDHGGGVTSVYGHLSSISVIEGQQVDKLTALGLEGSTGLSTGPHLHFEIRVNGQPMDPHKYISGQPYN